jgi:hypothetical protein
VLVEVCALISVCLNVISLLGVRLDDLLFFFFFWRKGGVNVKNWCYEWILYHLTVSLTGNEMKT